MYVHICICIRNIYNYIHFIINLYFIIIYILFYTFYIFIHIYVCTYICIYIYMYIYIYICLYLDIYSSPLYLAKAQSQHLVVIDWEEWWFEHHVS